MKVLYPNKNYTFSDAILETQPVAQVSGFRSFNSNTRRQEMKRRSDFSFAMIEMLEATYSKKISLLQELQLDNRLRRIYGILFDGSNFLKDLLLKKNIMSQQQIDEVLRSVDNVPMDLSLRDTIAANTVTNNTKESESMARAW